MKDVLTVQPNDVELGLSLSEESCQKDNYSRSRIIYLKLLCVGLVLLGLYFLFRKTHYLTEFLFYVEKILT